MRTRWLSVVLAVVVQAGVACAQAPASPSATAFTPVNPIDDLVLAVARKQGLTPAGRCSDGVFLRRAYLDVIGTLPKTAEAEAFFEDQRPDKRARLIEELLARDEFAQYWGLKWADALRIKSEFPINLWPNAVQAYDRWVRDAIRDNMPYDQFARELLTSSGSNFRVPAVNFFRAVQSREPVGLASAVALTFMGTRLETWPAAKRDELGRFFSRVAYKSTGEWKEEIVYVNPEPFPGFAATMPDGVKVTVAADQDPRVAFTDWLLSPENYWFKRAVVNRLWAWLMGRGIVHEPDDIRSNNQPVNPELLAYLEKELASAKFDLKHITRLILNSATYQQSCVAHGDQIAAEKIFAVYPVRQLDAEVLLDALCWLAGDGQGYCSQAPEPFTWVPENHRAITLADGSITSSFLEMFGRPSRDTGLQSERNSHPTDAQRLYLLNSTEIQRKIERSRMFAGFVTAAKGNRAQVISSLYLAILSRYPTEAEVATAEKYAQTPGLSQKQAFDDLAWALVNSSEFLYRH